MLKTSEVSLNDVLIDRRKYLSTRIVIALILVATFGPLLGWITLGAVGLIYFALQIVETKGFAPRNPWVPPGFRYREPAVLALLCVNATVFGAPSLFLARKLGSWGDVCAAYLLCGALLNTVLTAIGSGRAFRASAYPYFIYAAILPFASNPNPGQLTMFVRWSLLVGAVVLAYCVQEFWRKWSQAKMAEMTAVQSYIAFRDENERRLFEMTQRDALTGLLNRAVLQETLARYVAIGTPCALLLIDLDGFKYVNDTLGHSAGDTVLREIATRLGASVAEGDTAARLGGDEFALIRPGWTDANATLRLAERLIARISEPVTLNGERVNIGASAGIAIHPLHGGNAEDLFASADLALYQAKEEGRHCARLFHCGLRQDAHSKVLRDSELRQALDDDQFRIFYQPQVRLLDGALLGAEALLRWQHPEQGLLPPAACLKSLENGLLSVRIGDWVIETACRQAVSWRAELPKFRIAVNLFGSQFRSGNLVDSVLAACRKTGLPLAALDIEITENIILLHEDDVIRPLTELRAHGAGIAFDDFGTGFASLSMLTRYPVSRLKIDKRFTQAIASGPSEAAIIRAIVGLAASLDLRTTAEGVETAAEVQALIQAGCEEGQGYYFGAPMCAADFAAAFSLDAAA